MDQTESRARQSDYQLKLREIMGNGEEYRLAIMADSDSTATRNLAIQRLRRLATEGSLPAATYLLARLYLGIDEYSESLDVINAMPDRREHHDVALSGFTALALALVDYKFGGSEKRMTGVREKLAHAKSLGLRSASYFGALVDDSGLYEPLSTGVFEQLIRAAQLGDIRAVSYLGVRLQSSSNERDAGLGEKLVSCAALGGYEPAMFFIAENKLKTGLSNGDLEDIDQGIMFLFDLVEAMYGPALHNVALMQEKGAILDLDRTSAYVNYSLARHRGIKIDDDVVTRLAEEMSDLELLEAREQIAEAIYSYERDHPASKLIVELFIGEDADCADLNLQDLDEPQV